ncbi:SF0329 family protein [Clostridium sp. UBA6640]|uniref:SF0329 family protein n=1 Tax=Clostridium sp. UBA6640 TaxID=1946370 RepID=UPI0025B86E34|nr:hypothetical protein [Clostridium sp. UBA6640]
MWSKTKKYLESFVCETLKGRVEFFVTNYRKAHDEMGRAYITVDKKEVFNMCSLKGEAATRTKEVELKRSKYIDRDVYNSNESRMINEEARQLVNKEGIFEQYEFFNAVEEYLNNPIKHSLNSTNMIIKILSLIDRRVGKRTLENMKNIIEKEHELVKYFYKLRCEAEGIKIS